MCFGKVVSHHLRAEIVDFLMVKQVDFHEKYLGLPTFAARCKKDMFLFIKNQVWDKLKGWNSSGFPAAGKDILLKEVVQSLSCYDLIQTF